MSFLLTQFSSQTIGLRMVALALAVNLEMERRDKERYRILVPWVGGEQQRRALNETFGAENQKYPGEILLDEKLGRILRLFFITDMGHAASVAMWVAGWEDAGRQVRDHFNTDITVADLDGQPLDIGQPNIALELSRTPLFRLGIALAYQVTPGLQSRLFEAMGSAPAHLFALGRDLLAGAHNIALEIERNLCRIYLSVPGTFTSPDLLSADMLEPALIPPTVPFPPVESIEVPPSSVYVTVPEENGAEKRLQVALTWGVPIFTNDPERLGGGTRAAAGILTDPNIEFHFARADWESAHLSLRCEKPMLAPPYDPLDNPQIYFNNEKAWQWGLAQLFQEEELMDTQRTRLAALVPRLKSINNNLLLRFGTLDGTTVAARRIVEDLLK